MIDVGTILLQIGAEKANQALAAAKYAFSGDSLETSLFTPLFPVLTTILEIIAMTGALRVYIKWHNGYAVINDIKNWGGAVAGFGCMELIVLYFLWLPSLG